MPPIPMQWHSLLRHAKTLKAAASKALKALDAQLAGQRAALEPVLARNTPKQPLHPLARIRQSQSRQYSTARTWLNGTVREFSSPAGGRSGVKYDRASFPKSTVGSYVRSSSGRAPFASTLRPNLTGGTLGRTAGGYTHGAGSGARYFSHGPASQAQVVPNVSQAVRAFFISGQKAQSDGVNGQGEKRFKAVSSLQEETGRKMRSIPRTTPGSWIEFQINPTITALTPLSVLTGFPSSDSIKPVDHLNTDGLLDVLSVDFSRALKDLATVLNDLKRLSTLGDLPITYEASYLRIHFPGCDADSVERLCNELNIQRGTIVQDAAFDSFMGTEIALLFPFASSNEASMTEESCGAEFFEPLKPTAYDRHVITLDDMLSGTESPRYSTQSETGFDDILAEEAKPWLSSASGYASVRSGSDPYGSDKDSPLEYQGFEGIYRFIEELDQVRK